MYYDCYIVRLRVGEHTEEGRSNMHNHMLTCPCNHCLLCTATPHVFANRCRPRTAEGTAVQLRSLQRTARGATSETIMYKTPQRQCMCCHRLYRLLLALSLSQSAVAVFICRHRLTCSVKRYCLQRHVGPSLLPPGNVCLPAPCPCR